MMAATNAYKIELGCESLYLVTSVLQRKQSKISNAATGAD